MSDIITEALFEMHYHQKIIDSFRYVYGGKFLKIFKPSSQRESWVGFDQGWVRTNLTQEEFYNKLRNEIGNKEKSIEKFYFGYFLQFKTVRKIGRRSTLYPDGVQIPYYRSKLSLSPNKNTGLSQHETLLILNNIENTVVDYCCPMIFDLDELYEEPDIDKLRIVSLDGAPSGWATNEKHFIIFQNTNDDNPFWFSETSEGKADSLNNWITGERIKRPKKMNAESILDFISETKSILYEKMRWRYQRELENQRSRFNILPESMTIVQFENERRENA